MEGSVHGIPPRLLEIFVWITGCLAAALSHASLMLIHAVLIPGIRDGFGDNFLGCKVRILVFELVGRRDLLPWCYCFGLLLDRAANLIFSLFFAA